jgi:predicted DNA-binding WGR domain protein
MRRSGGAIEVLSRFGKIGAAGQTRVKTFATAEEAQAEVERMIAEKQKQGFR